MGDANLDFDNGICCVVDEVPCPSKDKEEEAVISFHDLCYTIEEKAGCCGCFREKKTRRILSNVSGIMARGINAIIGPTGSGKTSLLDVLANRKNLKWLHGKVFLNGKKLSKNFKYINGYVVQKDVLLGTLTVRECLWFSANLRLPVDTKHSEKERRIKELLDDLGLQKCADTKIGNEYIRGISGGERKRTTIGIELVTKPDVLYLDEPTSGLDSATAFSIMRLLKDLSNCGKTIVLSIHQPRYNIFRLFDSLTILAHGYCVYHGPASSALQHFNSIGYPCEVNNNPADFFLDVVNGLVKPDTQLEVNYNNNLDVEIENKHYMETQIAEQLRQKFQNSEHFIDCKNELDLIFEKSKRLKSEKSMTSKPNCSTTFWCQFHHLVKRDFTNISRNPQGLVGNFIINILISVIFGLIYLQLDDSPIQGTQNRFGLLLFVTTNLLFGSINVIELLMKSRSLFIHEFISGYYYIGSYFLAKLFADIIPMRTIAPLSYAIVTYWMAGLAKNASNFFIFLLISTLTGYAAVSIGVFFSVTFSFFSLASLMMILVFIFSIVFSGVLVNIGGIVPWLAWLQYLSVARYSIVGLSVNEFHGKNFSRCFGDEFMNELVGIYDPSFTITTENVTGVCVSISGDTFLRNELYIMPHDTRYTPWILWQNVVALSCVAFGMFFLTYIQLIRMKKYS